MIKARKARNAVIRTVLLLLVTAAASSLFLSCGVNTRAIAPTNPSSGGTNPATCPQPSSKLQVGGTHLAVADAYNGRVLIYNAPFTTGECASVELGQADFDSFRAYPEGPAVLLSPNGMAMEAGNLYVVDENGSRVVEFQPPFVSGMNASLEVGAPDFSTPGMPNPYPCSDTPPDIRLCLPTGVAVDVEGNVWAADLWDGRIVEYQQPIQSAMAASVAIGQTSLDNTADCDGTFMLLRDGKPTLATATELCHPDAIVFDESGKLWASDSGNSRVLEYSPPFSTGMAANLELGFPAATGMNSPVEADCYKEPVATQFSLCSPGALAFDTNGNLWVADSGNNRVLEFAPPFSDGMAATLVIGQQGFAEGTASPPAADTLYRPNGITFDPNGDLIVSDSGNSRVLVFSPPFRNGMSASVVIGQTNMTSGTVYGCGSSTVSPSASTLCSPRGVLAF